VGAEIWIATCGYDVLGYYTMLRKRWGTVKASTFVVKAEYQRRGVGRQFHQVVENTYDQDPLIRKIYHTAPVPETGHLRLDLEFGYRIEGHLRSHFTPGCDELVMGRRPDHRSYEPRDTEVFPAALCSDAPVTVAALASAAGPGTELPAMLAGWLSLTHEPVDRAYAARLLTGSPRRTAYLARTGDGSLAGMLILARKSVRLLKLNLQLDPARPSRSAFVELLKVAEAVASKERQRKLFLEVPETAVEMRTLLKQAGFRHEAHLDSPYKEGIDLALFSRRLE
jgi:hypothetical protein